MKKILLVIPLLFIILTGCAGIRLGIEEVVKEDAKNVATMRFAANNVIAAWPMWSGFIKGYLGADITTRILVDLSVIDAMSAETERTDMMRGFVLGSTLRFHLNNVLEGLQSIAPDIIRMLPAFITGGLIR